MDEDSRKIEELRKIIADYDRKIKDNDCAMKAFTGFCLALPVFLLLVAVVKGFTP